jgi:hypothetical protein
MFFWRTTNGKEIDYIEEVNGTLAGYEFKWKKEHFSLPKEFVRGYPGVKVEIVNRENYLEFVSK